MSGWVGSKFTRHDDVINGHTDTVSGADPITGAIADADTFTVIDADVTAAFLHYDPCARRGQLPYLR